MSVHSCDIEAVFHANSVVINNGEDTAVHVTGKGAARVLQKNEA